MSKILYTKYSNERAARFRIRTDIIEAEGKRFARKVPYCKEAKEHVENIAVCGEKLNKLYSNTKLSANKYEIKNDGIYFEYLEGKTFEQHLDDLLAEDRFTDIINEIEALFTMIKELSENKTFVQTDAFKSIYGDIDFPASLEAMDFNNIDYIFGNIFMGEKEWVIIDYEWTFDFPIPFLYIVYRAVHYYTLDPSREKLQNIGLLRLFGISEELEKCFELMEHRFQLYILGDTTPVVNMYNDIAGKCFTLEELLLDKVDEAEKQACVYYDFGQGFSEGEKKALKQLPEKTGSYRFEIETGGASAMRFDPTEECCVLSELFIYGEGNSRVSIMSYETNGQCLDKAIVFSTSDPQLTINNIGADIDKLIISYKIELISPLLAAEIIDELEDINYLRNNIEGEFDVKQICEEYSNISRYKAMYEEALIQKGIAEAGLGEMNALYNATMSSMSVRVTKPFRKLMRGIKKLIRSNKLTRLMAKGIKCIIKKGPLYAIKRFKTKLVDKCRASKSYKNLADKRRLWKQKNRKFKTEVKFSILVPLYNTPENYLREMIESVQAQTYSVWELCLADGSDNEHAYVGEICSSYMKKDSRIKYKKLEKNEGISENTNRCIEMATGNYIALFDHDDLLHPFALYENMCVIEEKGADFIYSDEDTFSDKPENGYCPHYKPDFSPDTLRSYNYICHFSVFKKSLLDEVGLFRKEFDGSQDYDMILRLTEKAKVIEHIPKIIYYWRAHPASVASNVSAKTYCLDAAKKALKEHLERVGLSGQVEDASIPSVYKINYEIKDNPKISILIPNKDYIADLSKCINSILEKSTYDNYEIIVIENNSDQESTFEYYKIIEKNEKVRVVYWEDEFNYSAINNFGATFANGDYILLLNNDMEIITPDWLQEMLMYAQRKDVGAVGAKLYYPDDTVQHAGVILGLGGIAGHSHKMFPRDAYGYSSRLQLVQNLSAVTAACLMLRREVFDEVHGLDEGFKVAFNDVDFCMKIRAAGYLIVFTPFAELYHYESKSRGYENTPEKVARFNGEIQRFRSKWQKELDAGDPYYNVNLSLDTEDFAIKPGN